MLKTYACVRNFQIFDKFSLQLSNESFYIHHKQRKIDLSDSPKLSVHDLFLEANKIAEKFSLFQNFKGALNDKGRYVLVNSNIVVVVGPPGYGKTTLSKSIYMLKSKVKNICLTWIMFFTFHLKALTKKRKAVFQVFATSLHCSYDWNEQNSNSLLQKLKLSDKILIIFDKFVQSAIDFSVDYTSVSMDDSATGELFIKNMLKVTFYLKPKNLFFQDLQKS